MKETNLELTNKDIILEQLTQSNKFQNDKISIIKNTRLNQIRAKYSNQYIGIVSEDLSSREEIGINFYQGSQNNFEWYFGEWKDNEREGLGFIKLGNEEFYFGNWQKGTFEGKGIYFWLTSIHLDNINRETNLSELEYQVFIGDFVNNEKQKGIYLMNELEEKSVMANVGYVGQINNNQKNDSDGLLIEFDKQRVYKGKIQNDEMIAGFYLHYNDINGSLSSDTMFKLNKKEQGGYDFVRKNNIRDNQERQEEILNKVRDVIKINNDFEITFKKLLEMIILQYEKIATLDYFSDTNHLLKELHDLFSTITIQ